MPPRLILELEQEIKNTETISDNLALQVLETDRLTSLSVMTLAHHVTQHHFGLSVRLCSILNAKSGACSENCAFCAQSIHHKKDDSSIFPLLSSKGIINAYKKATEYPIHNFSIVTSGEALSEKDVNAISETIAMRSGKTDWCGSLGCLSYDALVKLKRAGMQRFHHNLEAARSFYPQVCSTHPYEKRLETIRNAKRAGLEVCAGGVFGLGESNTQRVELARALHEERVDSIPLNFLIPIPGTPMENHPIMKPLEIFKTIAMFRLVNPTAEIRIAGGRNHLRETQPMVFFAGCSGMMVGDLLTVHGNRVIQDLQLLEDLELTPEINE